MTLRYCEELDCCALRNSADGPFCRNHTPVKPNSINIFAVVVEEKCCMVDEDKVELYWRQRNPIHLVTDADDAALIARTYTNLRPTQRVSIYRVIDGELALNVTQFDDQEVQKLFKDQHDLGQLQTE